MKNLVVLTFALIAVSVAGAAEHMVGGPPEANGNTIPFWATKACMRWQQIWPQSEIGEAGPITKIEFQTSASTSSGGTFNGCQMLLCHTSLSAITATFADNYDGKTPVTVFDGVFAKTTTTPSTWYTLFENPSTTLDYNNSDNLLFEVVWTSASGGTNSDMRKSTGGCGRVYDYATPNPTTGTVNAGYAHYARITISPAGVGVAPTSLGRVKSIFK